jgi:hypothetical protein
VAPAVGEGSRQETELTKELVGADCARPGSFVPNPANPDEFAWVDCWPDFNSNLSSALRVGSQTIGGDDYYEIVGIAWRPDGQQLVTVEHGEDKGIWLYNRDGSGTPQHVLNVTFDDNNSQGSINPSFVGNDRIAYYWNGEIRTVSTSCDKCSPDQGSPLLASPDGDGLAWTSRTLPVVQRGGTDPGAGPGTTPGTNPGTGPGTNPGNGDTSQRVTLAPRRVKLSSALKGLTVPFQAPAAGTLSLTAQLDAKTAKKLKLIKKGTKPVKVASGKAAPKAAGKASTKLKFTKTAVKRLKKAKTLKLRLVGTFTPAGGGPAQKVSATVTLKR